ncbi:MAG: hypothetical protein U5L45_04190 [Saprospiraceae bacterium]|nr:hypothetical protein [Saprospiraceae bacterium]
MEIIKSALVSLARKEEKWFIFGQSPKNEPHYPSFASEASNRLSNYEKC